MICPKTFTKPPISRLCFYRFQLIKLFFQFYFLLISLFSWTIITLTHTQTQSHIFFDWSRDLFEACRLHHARLLGVCITHGRHHPGHLGAWRAGRPTFWGARILTLQVLITSVSTGDHDWLLGGRADSGGTTEDLAVLSDFQLRKLPTFWPLDKSPRLCSTSEVPCQARFHIVTFELLLGRRLSSLE